MKLLFAALLASAFAAHGETLRVGSKRFTESYILGEILAQAAGAQHKPGLGNTAILVEALGFAAQLRDSVPPAKPQWPDEHETWGHA